MLVSSMGLQSQQEHRQQALWYPPQTTPKQLNHQQSQHRNWHIGYIILEREPDVVFYKEIKGPKWKKKQKTLFIRIGSGLHLFICGCRQKQPSPLPSSLSTIILLIVRVYSLRHLVGDGVWAQFIKLLLIQFRYSSMSELPVPSSPEITCKKIQNYIFNFSDLLGQGNFSKVYKAHHELTRETVAIKIIELNSLKSKKLEELLFSEIDILKKLNHPNVLRCHEVFTSNRNCYIITELCNQGDLESKIRSKRSLKEHQAESYIKDIFKGLLYLAENHIVHRDLKVANIFIHNGEAKLADFGFAKLTKSKFKDINIGSPIYMSPEGLIENIYGPKTDIWAFGMLIYELLHGETPFSHCKTENELKYNMSIPIGWSQLKAELSNQIKEVIIKCLEIDETKRISAFDLKRLPYFSRGLTLSPAKFITKENSLLNSYELQHNRSSPFHSGETLGLPSMRSENNFYDKGGKYRIRTENQIQQKRVQRQYSQLAPGRPSLSKEMFPAQIKQEKSLNYLKQPLDEEKNRKLSKGKYSISSNALTPNNFSRTALNSRQNSAPTSRGDMILSSSITFKECVNILHYCRLLFKHLILMKEMSFGDQNQSSIFKKWLSAILKTLMREIAAKRVRCDGENSQARERKLQEVTSEYIKKYSRDLGLDLSKVKLQESLIINYQKIYNYFTSIFQMVDQLIQKDSTNRLLLQLGHSIVMICDHTKIMKSCYDQRNYKRIERLKEIEEFLTVNKQHLDMPSYLWYKKKCWMNNVELS